MNGDPLWPRLNLGEKKLAIRAAVAEGAPSAAYIAQQMGTTKNAIIGFADRHKIPLPRKAHTKPAPKPTPRPRMAVKRTSGPIVTVARAPRDIGPEIAGGVTLMDAGRGQCRWPLWDALPLEASCAKFCGAAVDSGVYCAEHRALAYTAPDE